MTVRFLRTAGIPLIVFAAVGGVFGALKPGVARSALASPRALLITAGVVVITIAVTYATLRATRRSWLAAAAGLVPVAAFLAYTIAPAYHDVEVNDAAAVPAAAGDTGSGSSGNGEPGTGTGSGSGSAAATSPTSGAPGTGGSTAPGRPPEPQVLGHGALTGVNHRAAGTAYLLRDPATGAVSVVLARLDVEPGPDYEVHLVPGHGTTKPSGVRLAHLKGNRGTQSYPVPAGTSTSGPLSVLIWCRAFAVPIAVAPLG